MFLPGSAGPRQGLVGNSLSFLKSILISGMQGGDSAHTRGVVDMGEGAGCPWPRGYFGGHSDECPILQADVSQVRLDE